MLAWAEYESECQSERAEEKMQYTSTDDDNGPTENGFWSYLFIMKRFSRTVYAVDESHTGIE